MASKSLPLTAPFIYRESETECEHPNHESRLIKSLADALTWEQELRLEFFGLNKLAKKQPDAGTRLQETWFRGTWKHFSLLPGMYWSPVINNLIKEDKHDYWLFSQDLPSGGRETKREHKRLNIERDMILTFERESRPLLEYEAEQELYFTARHYGMPSRLLDWSISPLVALFMCVFPEPIPQPRGKRAKTEEQNPARAAHERKTDEDGTDEDGVLYAMDPEKLEPHEYICHQYDDMVEEAIEIITEWEDPYDKTNVKDYKKHAILAIRPHTLAGRIDRQHSRFTLHCHGAKPQKNPSLRSCRVSNDCKEEIRGQLERIGVNEFSVYYTLDRLASDVRDRFSNFRLHGAR